VTVIRRLGQSGLVSLQAHEPPPIAFVRALGRPRPRRLRQPLLFPQLCAAFRARGRF